MGLVKLTNDPKRWVDRTTVVYVEVISNGYLVLHLLNQKEIKIHPDEAEYESLVALFDRIETLDEAEIEISRLRALIDQKAVENVAQRRAQQGE